ncbi:MAG: B12-binding domain-containing radical SAM protein [Alistipes finegoldii]
MRTATCFPTHNSRNASARWHPVTSGCRCATWTAPIRSTGGVSAGVQGADRRHTRSQRRTLIIGGAGFSIYPQAFMRELGADYGIHGEGEGPLAELIGAGAGETGADIPAVYTRDGRTGNGPMGNGPAENRLSENERTENTPTENERTNSPTGNERTGNGRRSYLPAIEVEFEPELTGYYWKRSGMLNIQTKRGCPYDCIYCSYPSIDGRCVRTMDPEAIAENILRAKRDYGISYLFFTDSVFNIGPEYNVRLAEMLIRRRTDIRWGAYFSPRGIDAEQMRLFRASGLTHIEFGTESFCDRTLEAYGKRFTFGDVERASRLALDEGVYYAHFLILGGYGDTREHVRETIENSRRLEYTVMFPMRACASIRTPGWRSWPHAKASSARTTTCWRRPITSPRTSTWKRPAAQPPRRARRGFSPTTRRARWSIRCG